MAQGVPRWHSGKEPICQCRRHKRRRFDLWIERIPWRRKWQLTLVFLAGKLHGQRSLSGYNPWGRTESDTFEHAYIHAPRSLSRQKTNSLSLTLSLSSSLLLEESRAWATPFPRESSPSGTGVWGNSCSMWERASCSCRHKVFSPEDSSFTCSAPLHSAVPSLRGKTPRFCRVSEGQPHSLVFQLYRNSRGWD